MSTPLVMQPLPVGINPLSHRVDYELAVAVKLDPEDPGRIDEAALRSEAKLQIEKLIKEHHKFFAKLPKIGWEFLRTGATAPISGGLAFVIAHHLFQMTELGVVFAAAIGTGALAGSYTQWRGRLLDYANREIDKEQKKLSTDAARSSARGGTATYLKRIADRISEHGHAVRRDLVAELDPESQPVTPIDGATARQVALGLALRWHGRSYEYGGKTHQLRISWPAESADTADPFTVYAEIPRRGPLPLGETRVPVDGQGGGDEPSSLGHQGMSSAGSGSYERGRGPSDG
jgi:hypothetical protein